MTFSAEIDWRPATVAKGLEYGYWGGMKFFILQPDTYQDRIWYLDTFIPMPRTEQRRWTHASRQEAKGHAEEALRRFISSVIKEVAKTNQEGKRE
ncbi:hypothetical protein [Streptosporangium saharense]|uniref:hypothetical protein n=1 Tax=Streptosporangium saharense TaxID=1706840 RepID=UPI0033170A9B